MFVMRTIVASLVLSFSGVALGQGGVSIIVVEDPESTPTAPTCGEPDSYIMASDSPGVWVASGISNGTMTEAGLFEVIDEETIAYNLEVDLFGRTGLCSWVVCTGTFTPSGGCSQVIGMIRADVVLTGGGEYEAFYVGTVLTPSLAEETMTAVREGGGVVINPEDPSPEGALGSSCSCDACPGPGGGRFWVPFTVIGVGQTPGGTNCCGIACATACARARDGISESEAWLIGQGTWVLCMICQ